MRMLARDLECGRPIRGFTLIELLIVIGIILVLMTLVMVVAAVVGGKKKVTLALSEVRTIKAACEAYYTDLHEYPPDTEVFTTGNTPELVNDPYAICSYLGREITDQKTGRKYGPYFQPKLNYVKGSAKGKMLYLDPWGQPYRLDAVHSKVDSASGEATIYGEPYPAGTELARRVTEVKVWSSGPDRLQTSGSASEQGKNGSPGYPENDDNLCSWESN
ncbi:MAG TPA: prepilin-type N-terminal cleavage/methylation domain-containing protein [Planctomycetota bacterium]|nr:prepilin-type N-terminal cleavage/methylation domain-containing protein [Planctomycetota bacterium]